MNPKKTVLLIILLLLLLSGLLLCLVEGPVKTSLKDLWSFLFHHDPTHATIFLDLRLSRAILAFLVGASLSLSGAILQGYFQNPMAGPFFFGGVSGASPHRRGARGGRGEIFGVAPSFKKKKKK